VLLVGFAQCAEPAQQAVALGRRHSVHERAEFGQSGFSHASKELRTRRRQADERDPAILWTRPSLDQAGRHEPVTQPARRRHHCSHLIGELGDRKQPGLLDEDKSAQLGRRNSAVCGRAGSQPQRDERLRGIVDRF